MDCHGRVFYIDHKSHKTTWQKPLIPPNSDEKRKSGSDREEQLSDPEKRAPGAR